MKQPPSHPMFMRSVPISRSNVLGWMDWMDGLDGLDGWIQNNPSSLFEEVLMTLVLKLISSKNNHPYNPWPKFPTPEGPEPKIPK